MLELITICRRLVKGAAASGLQLADVLLTEAPIVVVDLEQPGLVICSGPGSQGGESCVVRQRNREAYFLLSAYEVDAF